MHLPLDIFLALRYLRPKRTFVSFITLLSILGPTLGVAILLIVNSIMAGFGKDIQENIMSWQAHLHVFPNMKSTMDEPEKIIEILEKHGVKASPLIQDSALIQVKASTLSGETEQVIQPMDLMICNGLCHDHRKIRSRKFRKNLPADPAGVCIF